MLIQHQSFPNLFNAAYRTSDISLGMNVLCDKFNLIFTLKSFNGNINLCKHRNGRVFHGMGALHIEGFPLISSYHFSASNYNRS